MAAPLHGQMKGALCVLVPRVAGGGQGGSPQDMGHSSVPSAGTSPGYSHQGFHDSVSHHSSGKVPVSWWRRQGSKGGAFCLPRLGTSPVVPPSVSCREVGSSRQRGWADPSLGSRASVSPPHHLLCFGTPRPGPAPVPKESPNFLVPGTKGSRVDRQELAIGSSPPALGSPVLPSPFPSTEGWGKAGDFHGCWSTAGKRSGRKSLQLCHLQYFSHGAGTIAKTNSSESLASLQPLLGSFPAGARMLPSSGPPGREAVQGWKCRGLCFLFP